MSSIGNRLLKRPYLTIYAQLNQTSNQESLLSLHRHLCPLVQHQDVRYAGHSKWQNIKHTKLSKDGAKSRLFNQISLAVTKAALKGTDPKLNKELSNILEVCRKENVSRDLIDRALKRAEGQKLVTGAKGILGPNNVIAIANFLYDNRHTRPSTFLKPINKTHKDFKFVDSKTLMNYFDKKGFIFIAKYDRNNSPVTYEKIEEVAIEAEVEEIEITCEEDKNIPPLPETNEAESKATKGSDEEATFEQDSDTIDLEYHWKLIVSEEEVYTAKGSIKKLYPDLVVKSCSIEYVAKDTVTLGEKELETFTKFYEDLSGVEELDKFYSNVNS